MGSKVYFSDMNCKVGDSLLDKMERVVRATGICDIDMERKFVAGTCPSSGRTTPRSSPTS